MADSGERAIYVKADGVSLRLTLSVKLQKKSFEEAVLRPFLKVYAKKTGEPADISRVARVEVDEEMLGDHSIAASVVLLARETVSAEVFLRPLDVQAAMDVNQLSADPFAPLPAEVRSSAGSTAGGRTVHAPAPRDISQDKLEFDEDNLTPIEKLKKERREAREARARLDAAASASAVLQDVSDAAPAPAASGPAAGGGWAAGSRVRVEGLTSAAGSQMNGQVGEIVAWRADKERWEVRLDGAEATVNVRPANLVSSSAPGPAAAAAAASDPGEAALQQLAATESSIKQLSSALRELEAGVRDLTAAGGEADTDGSFRAAARQMLTAHLSTINKLMAGFDEISLGEVADAAACAAARARKKAAASELESVLLPKATALRGQLDARPPAPSTASVPSAPAAPAAPQPPTAPAALQKQSAEIDSDED